MNAPKPNDIKATAAATVALTQATNAQIESIAKLLRHQQQYININATLQKTIGNIVKRRETDAKAANESIALAKKEAQAFSVQNKKVVAQAAVLKNLESRNRKFTKVKKVETAEFKRQKKEYDKLKEELHNISDSYSTYNKIAKDHIAENEKMAKSEEAIGKVASMLTGRNKKAINTEKEFYDAIENRRDAYKLAMDAAVESGDMTKDEAREAVTAYEDVNEQIRERNSLLEYSSDELQKQINAYEEIKNLQKVGAKGKIEEKMKGAAGEVRGDVKAVFGAKGFKGIYEAGKALTSSVEKFKGMREALKGTDKGATGLVGTMTSLGKAFGILGKMNWIALIISAVVGMAKAVNEMNKFITQYNKSFTKMYGPTVAIKNVRASMKEFTDAVFDMNRNLKYGLKSEDIMGLFEAMSQGGMSLAGVGKRVAGGYNEVIDQAVKLSKDFGVSMEQAGKMITDQMLELRMSLNDVSDAFKTISYDAAISGITSERFYESVSAATMALGMYGKYLDDASALLREFYKTGALGYKDASQQAEDMMGMFKNMSDSQRMAMISMTGGGAKWKGIFEAKAKDIENAVEAQENVVKGLKEQLKSASGAAKEDIMKRIGAEEDALKKQRANLIMLKKAAAGGETAMATALAYLSEEGPGVVLDVLKNIGQDIYDPRQWIVVKNFLMNTMKMSQEGAERFIATMQAGEAGLEKAAKDYIDTTSSIPDTNREKIAKLISDQMATGTLDISKLKADLVAQGLMTKEAVDEFGDQVADNADVMVGILKEGKLTSAEIKKIYEDRIKKPFKVSINMEADAAKKRMDDLIKNTTSIEDYLGIGKENLEYMRAMLAGGDIQAAAATAAMATARSTGAILGWVERIATGKKGFRTDEEFKQSKQWNKVIDLSRRQMKLQQELNDPHSKLNQLEKKELSKEISEIEQLRKEQLKGYEYLLPDAIVKAQSEEAEKAEIDIKMKDAGTAPENIPALQARKQELESTGVESTKKAKKMISGLETQREREAIYAGGAGAAPEAFDYITQKKGYQYLQKGDLVVDANKVAKGISGERGEFVNKLGGFPNGGGGAENMERLVDAVILKMSKFKVQAQNVNVPLTVSIGSVNGDADDLLNKIGPAIEQTFSRMFFERQKRK